MQLRTEALAARLAKGLPPVIWVHGDETLLVLEAGDLVQGAAREAGFGERIVLSADRWFRPAQLAEHTDSLSLFAESKLIELRIAGARASKELGEAVAGVAEAAPPGVCLLVTGPRAERAALESAWMRRIDAAGWIVAAPVVDRARLPDWIGERLARQQQHADRDTIALIAARVEGNLLAAQQEVRKLGLLCPPGALDAEAVRSALLNVARYDAFDLVDAMLAGDRARVLRAIDGLRAEGEAPPLAVWAVGEAVRALARIDLARRAGRPAGQALRGMRMPQARERRLLAIGERLEPGLAQSLLRRVAVADRMAKGVGQGDAWELLGAIALRIAGARTPALEAPP